MSEIGAVDKKFFDTALVECEVECVSKWKYERMQLGKGREGD